MPFDDKIGCAPQVVTACIALAVAIASVCAVKGNKKQHEQINLKQSAISHPITVPTVFVYSGVER